MRKPHEAYATLVLKSSLSQALTLYTTPVVFLYLERVNQWLARRSPAPAAERMLPPPSERVAD